MDNYINLQLYKTNQSNFPKIKMCVYGLSYCIVVKYLNSVATYQS